MNQVPDRTNALRETLHLTQQQVEALRWEIRREGKCDWPFDEVGVVPLSFVSCEGSLRLMIGFQNQAEWHLQRVIGELF